MAIYKPLRWNLEMLPPILYININDKWCIMYEDEDEEYHCDSAVDGLRRLITRT